MSKRKPAVPWPDCLVCRSRPATVERVLCLTCWKRFERRAK